jgi:hypothetical protein
MKGIVNNAKVDKYELVEEFYNFKLHLAKSKKAARKASIKPRKESPKFSIFKTICNNKKSSFLFVVLSIVIKKVTIEE